mgnify:CR=1 FL=1
MEELLFKKGDKNPDFQAGSIIIVDKPLTWTSFNVVSKIRYIISRKLNIKKIKVGHAGTLDPLATGLLIICTGKQTKNINEYQGQIKEYTGTFTIGATTPSYDLETEVNETFPTEHLTNELVHKTTEQFLGTIQQRPPIFSALKKDGKRLYELARKGETTEIPTREITINEFEITNIEFPKIDFRVVCSKGTYIRSLAFDFGKALNSGAHLSALRRTKIGKFPVEKAVSINDFIENLEKE